MPRSQRSLRLYDHPRSERRWPALPSIWSTKPPLETTTIAQPNLWKLPSPSARKAHDRELIKKVVARGRALKEAEGAYSKVREALVRLEDSPTDPEANQVAGEYFCFIKGDWGKGMPMLALGSDEAFRALAQKDLKGASSPEEQVKVGDGWWECGAVARR